MFKRNCSLSLNKVFCYVDLKFLLNIKMEVFLLKCVIVSDMTALKVVACCWRMLWGSSRALRLIQIAGLSSQGLSYNLTVFIRLLMNCSINYGLMTVVQSLWRVKCSKTIESSRSSSACDEKVKVTFCKDSLTRLFTIDNIETEVHNDDDPEDPDEEDFIDF